MIDKLRQELDSVPSRQYKLNIITCIVCWAIALAAFIPLSVYAFCYYASTSIWWLGFVALVPVVLSSAVFGPSIKWLYSRYKQALKREQEKQVTAKKAVSEETALF